MVELAALALDVPPTFFKKQGGYTSTSCVLRLAHYITSTHPLVARRRGRLDTTHTATTTASHSFPALPGGKV